MFKDYEYYDDFVGFAFALFLINLLLWVVSLIIGKAWPVDFIWSSWPVLHLGYLLYDNYRALGLPHGSDWYPYVHLVVTLIHNVRLTSNFIKRGGIGHEDWRYTDMRQQLGRMYPVMSFVTVFAAQSTFMFLGCLPFFIIARNTHIHPVAVVLGATVSCVGIGLEMVADEQLNLFTQKKRLLLKEMARPAAAATVAGAAPAAPAPVLKQVLDTGLWQYSRHPVSGPC